MKESKEDWKPTNPNKYTLGNKLKEVITMARKLVTDKQEEEEVAPKPAEAVKPVPQEPAQEQVQIATMEQLILAKLDNLTALTLEGFKQVGVDFDKPKE